MQIIYPYQSAIERIIRAATPEIHLNQDGTISRVFSEDVEVTIARLQKIINKIQSEHMEE